MTASAIAPLPPGKLPVESSRPAQAIVESACEFVTKKNKNGERVLLVGKSFYYSASLCLDRALAHRFREFHAV